MMKENNYQADTVIIGGGISGITTAIELLNANKKVIIIERDLEQNFGGLAKESFGGMFFIDSPPGCHTHMLVSKIFSVMLSVFVEHSKKNNFVTREGPGHLDDLETTHIANHT